MVPFSDPTETAPLTGGVSVATGAWKDGLFDCFSNGICHPSLCCALFFPEILMGQVLTRLRFDMWGNPTDNDEYRKTFKRVVALVVSYWILSTIFKPSDPELDQNGELVYSTNNDDWKSVAYSFVTAFFGLYSLIVMIKLRYAIRQKYKIPSSCCATLEDCCCVFWCNCCTISQMARQTADYHTGNADCLSDTGLKPLVPAVVV